MKQSDPLELVSAGTLARPGPLGRVLRFVMALLCAYVLTEVFRYWDSTTAYPFATLPNRFLVLLAPMCVSNYVVNIGFTRNWGRLPLLVSVIGLAVIAVAAFLGFGAWDNPFFGTALNVWLAYFYGHLGLSFLLAAVIATPGCEMRAIPELMGKLVGRDSEEHHCPAGFITQLDEWERRRMAK